MEAYFFALRTRGENTTNSPFKRMAEAPVPRQTEPGRGTGLFRPLVAYFEIGSGPFLEDRLLYDFSSTGQTIGIRLARWRVGVGLFSANSTSPVRGIF